MDRQTGTGPVTIRPILTTPSTQTCQPHHIRRGYEKFQNINSLQISGFCDNMTKAYMSKRRCGQPDIFTVEDMLPNGYTSEPHMQHSTDHYNEQSYQNNRSKRSSKTSTSIKEIIAAQVGQDELKSRRILQFKEILQRQPAKHETYNNGQSTRRRRSIDFGTSLFNIVTGSDFNGILRKTRITWRLMSAHTTPQIPVDVQNSLLAQAFRYWGEVSPLCFVEDKHSRFVDIEVGFLEGKRIYIICSYLCLTCYLSSCGDQISVNKYLNTCIYILQPTSKDEPSPLRAAISASENCGLCHSITQIKVLNKSNRYWSDIHHSTVLQWKWRSWQNCW